jgi:hypothetical protein
MLKYKIRKKIKEKGKKKSLRPCAWAIFYLFFLFFKFNPYIKLKDLIKCKYIIRLLISQIIFITNVIGEKLSLEA